MSASEPRLTTRDVGMYVRTSHSAGVVSNFIADGRAGVCLTRWCHIDQNKRRVLVTAGTKAWEEGGDTFAQTGQTMSGIATYLAHEPHLDSLSHCHHRVSETRKRAHIRCVSECSLCNKRSKHVGGKCSHICVFSRWWLPCFGDSDESRWQSCPPKALSPATSAISSTICEAAPATRGDSNERAKCRCRRSNLRNDKTASSFRDMVEHQNDHRVSRYLFTIEVESMSRFGSVS